MAPNFTARTTFVLDAQGIIRHVFRAVKVADHVDAVLDVLTT